MRLRSICIGTDRIHCLHYRVYPHSEVLNEVKINYLISRWTQMNDLHFLEKFFFFSVKVYI